VVHRCAAQGATAARVSPARQKTQHACAHEQTRLRARDPPARLKSLQRRRDACRGSRTGHSIRNRPPVHASHTRTHAHAPAFSPRYHPPKSVLPSDGKKAQASLWPSPSAASRRRSWPWQAGAGRTGTSSKHGLHYSVSEGAKLSAGGSAVGSPLLARARQQAGHGQLWRVLRTAVASGLRAFGGEVDTWPLHGKLPRQFYIVCSTDPHHLHVREQHSSNGNLAAVGRRYRAPAAASFGKTVPLFTCTCAGHGGEGTSVAGYQCAGVRQGLSAEEGCPLLLTGAADGRLGVWSGWAGANRVASVEGVLLLRKWRPAHPSHR
jgi:hypothetical protein